MTEAYLERVQRTLRQLGIPAWLLYNFRDSNPIATRVIGMPPDIHQTRRWAYLIPAHGEPCGLVHRIEPHLRRSMPGETILYSSHEEFFDGLASMLRGLPTVAMEYSPRNEIPVISKVDAGTIELVRSLGVEVVPSGTLIAHLEAVLSEEQLASALRAGVAVRETMMSAFRFIRDRICAGTPVGEYDVQQEILREFGRRGLVTDHPPMCSVGANSANPHYELTAEGSHPIVNGDFVLIDLWGRERNPDAIFGDITWVGYVGRSVPDRYRRVFRIVRDARDAAFHHVRDAFAASEEVTGADVDRTARGIIEEAGYGEQFVHRTGHSITTELHGAGANLDSFETEDTRPILPGTSFSIEPGIYIPGEFGIRSELDVVIGFDRSVIATSDPVRQEVIAILGENGAIPASC
jgi:Xaa-Pro dipeptidase